MSRESKQVQEVKVVLQDSKSAIRVYPVTYISEGYSLVVKLMGLTFHTRQPVMRLDLMWINGEKSQLTGRHNSQNTKRELVRSLLSSPRFSYIRSVSIVSPVWEKFLLWCFCFVRTVINEMLVISYLTF